MTDRFSNTNFVVWGSKYTTNLVGRLYRRLPGLAAIFATAMFSMPVLSWADEDLATEQRGMFIADYWRKQGHQVKESTRTDSSDGDFPGWAVVSVRDEIKPGGVFADCTIRTFGTDFPDGVEHAIDQRRKAAAKPDRYVMLKSDGPAFSGYEAALFINTPELLPQQFSSDPNVTAIFRAASVYFASRRLFGNCTFRYYSPNFTRPNDAAAKAGFEKIYRALMERANQETVKVVSAFLGAYRVAAADIDQLALADKPAASPYCDDIVDFDEAVLEKVFDTVGLTKGAIPKHLLSVYKKHLTNVYKLKVPSTKSPGKFERMSVSQIDAVIKNLDHIKTAMRIAEALGAGDSDAAWSAAKDATEAFVAPKAFAALGIPLGGEILTAIDITMQSQAELKRQEDLLNVDLGFYDFLYRPQMQQALATNPQEAVRLYVQDVIKMDRDSGMKVKHREILQSYLDLMLPDGEKITIYGPDHFDKVVNLGLDRTKLNAITLTMLRDFEAKAEREAPRRRMTRARQQAQTFLSSGGGRVMNWIAKSPALDVAALVTRSAGFPEWTKSVCDEYRKLVK